MRTGGIVEALVLDDSDEANDNIEDKVDNESTWKRLQNQDLKKGVGFLLTAQEQALSMNSVITKMWKSSGNSRCQLCKTKDEPAHHLGSACSKTVQTDC